MQKQQRTKMEKNSFKVSLDVHHFQNSITIMNQWFSVLSLRKLCSKQTYQKCYKFDLDYLPPLQDHQQTLWWDEFLFHSAIGREKHSSSVFDRKP